MAQHYYIISNQTFPNTRADINNVLSAIATNNSGTSAPASQFAGQFWIDTTSSTWTLYIHDGTDDIQFATIDTSANTVNFIDSELGDNSVTTSKIADGNVTSAKLSYPLTTFSSTGIDDNATSTAITIDSSQNVQINVGNVADSTPLIIKGGETDLSPLPQTVGMLLGYSGASGFNKTGLINEFEDASGRSALHIVNNGSANSSDATKSDKRITIDYNGDISFYEDTGTTPKLFWDASTERLGIGTTSPDAPLEVNSGTSDTNSIFKSTDNNCLIIISDNDSSSTIAVESDGSGGVLKFNTGGNGSYSGNSEAMRIDSSGNVGIGTSSPSYILDVSGTGGTRLQSDTGTALNVYRTASTSTNDVMHLNSDFGGTNTKNFQIEADGDVQNTNNSYGSISDRKFKENETDANSQWNDIKALQIKNYNLKKFPDTTHLGVIAQDLEASGMNGLVKNKPDVFYTEYDVLPEGKNVGDIKEESYKEVKYSILYMKSVKALQEAMERIESLEAEVTALKNQP